MALKQKCKSVNLVATLQEKYYCVVADGNVAKFYVKSWMQWEVDGSE